MLANGVFKIPDDLLKQINNEQWTQDDFVERFGDCYIAGFEGGGSFTSIIEIHTKSESDKTAITQV